MYEMSHDTGTTHADESAIENIFAKAGVPEVSARAVGAEIDRQIATAKKYPRRVSSFLHRAKDMACSTKQVAESCFYSLRRGGSKIEGPSIRLAEIVAAAYGNVRVSSRVVDVGDEFVSAEGSAIDLETNTGFSEEVQRRILNKEGQRYNIDMIGVTGAAACAIAERNAIFKIIPRALVDGLVSDCKAAALGKGATVEQLRNQAVDWWAKTHKVSADEMCAFVDCAGIEDLGFDQLHELRGLATAIRDGMTSLDEQRERIRQAREGDGYSDVPPRLVAQAQAPVVGQSDGMQPLFDGAPGPEPDSPPKGKRAK